jgi:MbtH protein
LQKFDDGKEKFMSQDKEDDWMTYKVVVNHEQQYSIWPDFKAIPDGWQAVGKAGSKETCLAYIKETWGDMRPFSHRSRMDAARQSGAAG